MAKFLGIDIGDHRTGVAIADDAVSLALPRGIIIASGRDDMIARIVEIIDDEQIQVLVVGIPYTMKGEIAHQAEKTLQFLKHLKRSLSIPVEMIDERLTTKASRGGGDDEAAALILQTWLDRRKLENS